MIPMSNPMTAAPTMGGTGSTAPEDPMKADMKRRMMAQLLMGNEPNMQNPGNGMGAAAGGLNMMAQAMLQRQMEDRFRRPQTPMAETMNPVTPNSGGNGMPPVY